MDSYADLARGATRVVPLEEFKKKLERSEATGKPLRVKFGVDPTGADIHLGHTVPLRRLRAFQDRGHEAVIVIGDYTAIIGDPSGRDEARVGLTQEAVQANAKGYLEQIGKIVDMEKAQVVWNGDWLGMMDLNRAIKLMRSTTIGQITAREDFADRLKAGKPVGLHECLYPLLQGYDSVVVHADVEIGGSDQLFNMHVARDLQVAAGQEPQVCLTMPILVGTDGVKRMGKSLGNHIPIADSPEEMFGKIMSIPDTAMRQYFEFVTMLSPKDIAWWLGDLPLHDPGPMAAKDCLAFHVVHLFHGEGAASRAHAAFHRSCRREDPEIIPEVELERSKFDGEGLMRFDRFLVELGLAQSTSDARRLIKQRGVIFGESRMLVDDFRDQVEMKDDIIIRVGKRRIVKVRLI